MGAMTTGAMTTGAIELRQVSKAYGPTLALAPFSHVFEPGRIHALMGKNGSGKSTLIKILAGAVQPGAGRAACQRQPAASFASPREAFEAGMVTVHQELSLVPSLSVGENIYLGRLPHRRRAGRQRDRLAAASTPTPGRLLPRWAWTSTRISRSARSASGGSRWSRSSRRCRSRPASCCWTSRPRRWPRARWRCCSRCCAGCGRAA